MKYDLAQFDRLVSEGYIRRVETEDLVLYNYTDKCTYERYWDDCTKAARGIIFEKSTGKLVAKPFLKFFNLGEMPETQLLNLPNEPYEVTEKMDGSLGIIYYYGGKWNVATRGSFNSEQAQKAQGMLKKYDTAYLNPMCTYLVEIIYPENKIVVNYGQIEALVLLGVYHLGIEAELPVLHESEVFPIARPHRHTIQEMISLQQTMPKDQEGFVVRFKSGLRVKIKGHEYLKIHKIISNLSPLSFWEAMENGTISSDYLSQIPEEYAKDFQPIVDGLERQYRQIKLQIMLDADKLPSLNPREVGIFLAAPNTIRHPAAMFHVILSRPDRLDFYIMQKIRPDGNILREIL